MKTGVDVCLVDLFVDGSTHEIQTAVVTERSPLGVDYHL